MAENKESKITLIIKPRYLIVVKLKDIKDKKNISCYLSSN